MREFVGLRAKMYSFVLKKDGVEQEKKTAKGINKSVTEREIRHADYVHCLFNKAPQEHSMTQIRSVNHQLQTVKLTKTSLSPYDDKRYILEDGISTLARGHYKTRVGMTLVWPCDIDFVRSRGGREQIAWTKSENLMIGFFDLVKTGGWLFSTMLKQQGDFSRPC